MHGPDGHATEGWNSSIAIGATHHLRGSLSFAVARASRPCRVGWLHGRDRHATITSNNIIPIGATHHLRGTLSFAVARASNWGRAAWPRRPC